MQYKETYEKFWGKNKEGKFKDYVRNLALVSFFPVIKMKKKICDIAGGPGIVTEWLQNRGYEVTLVEFSDSAVQEARKKGITNIIQKEIGGLCSLPFTDNYFDEVFFGDIIEHLFDSESALKEVKRILKPNGRLVVSCPNIAYWRFRTYYFLDGDFQRIDVAKQKPWEQEHIRFFNIKILKEFFGKLGFVFSRYEGVNDVWHSSLLSKFFPNFFSHTIISEFLNKK